MTYLLLTVLVLIIVEHFTHKTILEIAKPIISKVWGVIEWFIAFLFRMNEPFGKKS